MAVRRTTCYDQALACDVFDKFCNASTLKDILINFRQLCKVCKLTPTNYQDFYPKLKAKIPSWRAGELWTKLEKRASQPCYGRGRFCSDTRVLIIGGGPCGLRTAIEAQLLGAKTVLIEKRESFSRNNVLHLWPFTITDLRNLGAKLFHGKFCAGSIDHISIRQLQCILLKIALLLGVEFHESVSFEGLIEPENENDLGWKASVLPKDHPVSHFHFDVVIGADGRRNTLPGFKRKALRAKLAIAITANFVNHHTEAEARVQEISGVSYIFKQQFFQELEEAMNISLENIVYYKDETHYFVMTPTKQSLLDKGVLFQDFPDPESLLSPENIDPEALQLFTMEAVVFATDNKLPDLQFALTYRKEPDLALFDFTTMYASENACRVLERKGHKLLMGLTGDSLLEPFWPTGSGLGRGFLGALDAAWMIRRWGKGLKSVLEVLAERESIYRLLAQTTQENLCKDHNQYSMDPSTRYPKINLAAVNPRQIKALYESDEPITNIFISIRESRRSRLVPEDVILKWFNNHLLECGINIGKVLDVFTNREALSAMINRFRPDLIDFPILEEKDMESGSANQQVFETLLEEYEIPIMMTGEESIQCTETETPTVIEYLSQLYNAFKGEIPRNGYSDSQEEHLDQSEDTQISCPNNSALHHSLSIKQFLQAKESLKEKKVLEEATSKRERRRSQFYESIMQSQSNYNQQRSTSSANIPVVKLNPVPPSELFSACRNGCDRETSDSKSSAVSIKLKRSRSDLGHMGGPLLRGSHSKRSELEEVQLRIRKTPVTPLGDMVSTFLGKHVNQNASSRGNGESDENPLSSERTHLRPARPRSVYQNVNDCPSNKEMEDQENGGRSSNNPFHNPEQDEGFKERCKFMEKNLYNSVRIFVAHLLGVISLLCINIRGRDLKVHIGAAWFLKQEQQKKEQKNQVHRQQGNPDTTKNSPTVLQKSQSFAVAAGFHPLKGGSKMEESFNNPMKEREEKGQKGFNPKALFFGQRIGEIVDRHVQPADEWKLRQKSPSPKPRNDHYHHHQQSGTSNDIKTTLQNNKEKSQKGKKFTGASSSSGVDGVDSDLDCFLNTIDFQRIDGQDLQELLSSY